MRLRGGDSLLMSLPQERVDDLRRDATFVVVSEVGLPRYQSGKLPLALAILAGVIAVAALNIMPIVISAVLGAALMLLTGCLTNEEAYEAINWRVILLLAGVLPLGVAMEKTGAAQLLADHVLSLLGEMGPGAVLSGFLLLTVLLTNIISNQAAAALLAPVAIQTAATLQVSARPFLMAVIYAA